MSRRRVIIVVALLLLYVGSYLALSRQGFAQADRWNVKGFWFFEPRDSDLWRFSNYGCVAIYYPLIVADNYLGTGRWPTREPLLALGKALSQAIYPERAFDLGYGLQEAGVTDPDRLGYRCEQEAVPVRWCWVADLLLGKE